mgnify:CR=1 FL=1
MSVKIEVLDYDYETRELAQMNPDWVFQSPSSWTIYPLGSWIIANGDASLVLGQPAGTLRIPMTFIEGQRYRIKYRIKGLTQGFIQLPNHMANPADKVFNTNTNGYFEADWIQGANNLNRLNLRGRGDGVLDSVRVFPISDINWENSVLGELDVTDHTDFPLAMTFQISDFKDLTSTSGDYSKTFKIPATKNNNTILQNLYIPNIKGENQVPENKPCRIMFNNLYSLVGQIKVTEVSGYGETASHYNCVFYGSNLTWANLMQDSYMSDIEWGDEGENLLYQKDDIMATWQHLDSDNISKSPIVYPITSYGDYNPTGESNTIQLLDTQLAATSQGAGAYYGSNNNVSLDTPIPSADWRPAVFIKTTFDKIFNGIGYKIVSDFMNKDMFKKLVWLLPNFSYNNTDERIAEHSVLSYFSNNTPMTAGTVEEDGIQALSAVRTRSQFVYTEVLNLNTLISDPSSYNFHVTADGGSNVDLVNNYITIGEYGNYNVSIEGLVSRIASVTSTLAYGEVSKIGTRIIMQFQTVGNTGWSNISDDPRNDLYPNSSPSVDDYRWLHGAEETRYFNKGDKIRLSVAFDILESTDDPQGDIDFNVSVFFQSRSGSEFRIELIPDNVMYGQTYNLSDVMSSDDLQIDFIKGVAHAFNMQISTNESTKTVNIEPYDNFFKPLKDAIDWTYKLDRSNQTTDKWIKSNLKRNIIFKYKNDSSDLKVKQLGEEFYSGYQDILPYMETLPLTFDKGETVFENPFFAGTYNAKDNDINPRRQNNYTNDPPESALLWSEVAWPAGEYRPDKGYNFLPRLLYWNKYSPSPALAATPKRALVQTWAGLEKFIIANADAVGVLSNIFPQATSINSNSTTSPLLSYGNANANDYNSDSGTYTESIRVRGLFAEYYANMFNQLKKNSRIRTVHIDLKITDIINLDFTKLIYIDGVYWRINKIIDYKPNQNEPTKVELIEWSQIVSLEIEPADSVYGGEWNPYPPDKTFG